MIYDSDATTGDASQSDHQSTATASPFHEDGGGLFLGAEYRELVAGEQNSNDVHEPPQTDVYEAMVAGDALEGGEGRTYDSRDRDAAQNSDKTLAQTVRTMLAGPEESRPLFAAAFLIMSRLHEVSSGPNAERDRRRILACFNHELSATSLGLWVTYDHATGRVGFAHSNRDRTGPRAADSFDADLPTIQISRTRLDDLRAQQALATTVSRELIADMEAFRALNAEQRTAQEANFRTRWIGLLALHLARQVDPSGEPAQVRERQVADNQRWSVALHYLNGLLSSRGFQVSKEGDQLVFANTRGGHSELLRGALGNASPLLDPRMVAIATTINGVAMELNELGLGRALNPDFATYWSRASDRAASTERLSAALASFGRSARYVPGRDANTFTIEIIRLSDNVRIGTWRPHGVGERMTAIFTPEREWIDIAGNVPITGNSIDLIVRRGGNPTREETQTLINDFASYDINDPRLNDTDRGVRRRHVVTFCDYINDHLRARARAEGQNIAIHVVYRESENGHPALYIRRYDLSKAENSPRATVFERDEPNQTNPIPLVLRQEARKDQEPVNDVTDAGNWFGQVLAYGPLGAVGAIVGIGTIGYLGRGVLRATGFRTRLGTPDVFVPRRIDGHQFLIDTIARTVEVRVHGPVERSTAEGRRACLQNLLEQQRQIHDAEIARLEAITTRTTEQNNRLTAAREERVLLGRATPDQVRMTRHGAMVGRIAICALVVAAVVSAYFVVRSQAPRVAPIRKN